jgi:hypothetical protein
MYHGAELMQPKRQPAALEAGVASDQERLPAVESAKNGLGRNRRSPNFPRRLARGPKLFKLILVAQSVHGPPKTVMFERHKLALAGQLPERPAFPTGVVAFNQFKTLGREHEKAPIDQAAIAGGLFDEVGHPGVCGLQGAVAARGLHGRNSG